MRTLILLFGLALLRHNGVNPGLLDHPLMFIAMLTLDILKGSL